jgi:hypothetical protein
MELTRTRVRIALGIIAATVGRERTAMHLLMDGVRRAQSQFTHGL